MSGCDSEERRLLARVLNGHADDFAYFVDKYGREVFCMVARLVAVQADAEDISQEVFVKAFSKLGSNDAGRASFSTWIGRIAYNEAVSFLRRERKMLIADEDEALLNDVPDNAVNEVLASDNEELLRLVDLAVGQLQPQDKTLVRLFYYENRPLEEIAYIVGLKAGNVATRLCRIRKKLYLKVKALQNEQR